MKSLSPIYHADMETFPECFFNGRYVAPNKMEIHFEGIIASEVVYHQGLSSVWHYHKNPHFSHILSGASVEVREYDQQLQTSGTSLFYNPCMPHKNINYMDKTRIFNLELKQDFFSANQLAYSDSENYWSLYDAHFKKNLLIKILTEYRVNDIHSAIAIEQLCVLLCEQQITKTVYKEK